MATLNDIETKVQSIITILKSRTVKTITGILPLTFTTHTAGAADDWLIYGNDDNGTENLFDKSTAILGKEIRGNGIFDNADWAITPLIPVEPQSYYSTLSFGVARLEYMSENDNNPTRTIASSQNPTLSTTHFIRLNVAISNLTTATLVKGSTAPDHYISYQNGVGEQRVDGYYVPLTISQTGQTDKNYDIYIGDSPLTEGETISKTSTGVDLELFEGENTVSTTLYNKPEMTIKYKNNGGN